MASRCGMSHLCEAKNNALFTFIRKRIYVQKNPAVECHDAHHPRAGADCCLVLNTTWCECFSGTRVFRCPAVSRAAPSHAQKRQPPGDAAARRRSRSRAARAVAATEQSGSAEKEQPVWPYPELCTIVMRMPVLSKCHYHTDVAWWRKACICDAFICL